MMKKPYTRFYIHYMDIARMEELLEKNGISFFAMEMKVSQMDWILHIPDKNLKEFDELVLAHKFELSPMNHSFWFQDRDRDAMQLGFWSKPGRVAVFVILLVILVVWVLGFIF